MHLVPCPILASELEYLSQSERLTDREIAARIGQNATEKRVRAWRKRFGIATFPRWKRHVVPAIEGDLKSLLVGSMLGDGRLCFRTNATHYSERHGENQKEYLQWKMNQWGDWVKVTPKLNIKTQGDKSYKIWRFHTVAHEFLNEWQSLFYARRDRGWKRLVPTIAEHVDSFALAIWYLDDGSAGWWPDITFGSTKESRQVALAIFEKFGLKPRWQCKMVRGEIETGVFHMEREDTAERFLSIIQPHVPACMGYKVSSFGYQ